MQGTVVKRQETDVVTPIKPTAELMQAFIIPEQPPSNSRQQRIQHGSTPGSSSSSMQSAGSSSVGSGYRRQLSLPKPAETPTHGAKGSSGQGASPALPHGGQQQQPPPTSGQGASHALPHGDQQQPLPAVPHGRNADLSAQHSSSLGMHYAAHLAQARAKMAPSTVARALQCLEPTSTLHGLVEWFIGCLGYLHAPALLPLHA